MKRRMLRWLMTQWCNYACRYCRQDHRRHQTFMGAAGHWRDNADLQLWLSAFQAHFGDTELYLTLTGGEPMLGYADMTALLEGLTAMSAVQKVRIDTNMSWTPERWSDAARQKALLMCSYHPSETEENSFFGRVKRAQDAGWNVSMVQLVVLPDRFDMLPRLAERFARIDVPLSAMPVFGTLKYYSEAQVEVLRRYVPSEDWHFRTGGETAGTACSYPSLAYEMYPAGQIEVACHPHLAGSLFDSELPQLSDAAVACPHRSCSCVDRYSYNSAMPTLAASPTEAYSSRLKALEVL